MTIAWLYNKPLHTGIGGTEMATLLAMDFLKRKGHNNIANIVINDNNDVFLENDKINDLYTFLKENKIDIIVNQIGYEIKLLSQFLALGGKKWKEEGGKIITFLHFDPKFPSTISFFKSKLNKNIRDYINIAKQYILAPYYIRKEKRKYTEIYRYLYNNSDNYVTLSETFHPYIKKILGLKRYDKLYAINNPLTFDNISPASIINKKKKIVLIVARMSEFHKRISICLKVWKQVSKKTEFKEWELKIVGIGADLENYKQYVKKHNIAQISFEGEQFPEKYYEEASIFLMTSLSEGWGLTITESLQRGVVPIIMNSSAVFSEIVESKVSGILVKNNDIKAYQKELENLMRNTELRCKMAVNCLQRATLFTKEVTAQKWYNLIDKLT